MTGSIIGNPRDNNFHIKNFFLFYKKLLNLNMLKNDRAKYMNRLKIVSNMVKDIDFHQNILFICSEMIPKEVFLAGFTTMKKLKTFYYCNTLELYDIWEGNRKKDNINLSDEDIMYSEQDIKQDVFCLYADIDMKPLWIDQAVKSLVSSRTDRCNSIGEPLYNWIFFRGTYSDIKDNQFGYAGILEMFISHKDDGYVIVDLNDGKIHHNIKNKTNGSKDSIPSLNSIY